jgi:hypothetical protein
MKYQDFEDGFFIEGDYSRIMCFPKKEKFTTEIFSVGSCESTPTDREQIAYFMSAELPCSDYLTYAEDVDQMIEWVKAKDYWVRLAICFEEEVDNPLLGQLEEGLISQVGHDLIHLDAKYWDSLWKLIQHRWEPIQEAWSEVLGQTFNQSRELLQEILIENADNNYLKCFKPHYQRNVREIKEMTTLRRKSLRGEILSKAQTTRLENLLGKHFSDCPKLESTIAICEIGAERDPFIATYLKIIETIESGVLKIQQGAMCKAGVSCTWVDGRKHPGILSVRQLEKKLYKS